MDYFQGVVTEFLRADRAVFVNPECLIQLDATGPKKGRHWYCDALAVNFREKAVYLCEVTYSGTMHSLLSRLKAWDQNWIEMCTAICRDNGVPTTWQFQPWVFIPDKLLQIYNQKLPQFMPTRTHKGQMPNPRVTLLEQVVPWQYEWDRKGDRLVSDSDRS